MNPANSGIAYPTPRVGMSRSGKIIGIALIVLCVAILAQGVYLFRHVHQLSAPDQALFEAVNLDDTKKIEAALRQGANINAHDRAGSSFLTPLTEAVSQGCVKAAETLCKHGANSSTHTGENWNSPYEYAANLASQKRAPMLRVLVRYGLEVNSRDYPGQRQPLSYALDDKDVALVNLCLDKGADPNATDQFGDTALAWALEHDEGKLAARLLNKGANVQMSRLIKGYVALAISHEQYDLTKTLLDKGASIKDVADGAPPLLWAVAKGRADLVTTLLDKGANVEAKDDAGDTALIGAAKMGRADLVRLLLAHHADPNKTAPGSPTALQWANLRHHEGVARLLKATGGR